MIILVSAGGPYGVLKIEPTVLFIVPTSPHSFCSCCGRGLQIVLRGISVIEARLSSILGPNEVNTALTQWFWGLTWLELVIFRGTWCMDSKALVHSGMCLCLIPEISSWIFIFSLNTYYISGWNSAQSIFFLNIQAIFIDLIVTGIIGKNLVFSLTSRIFSVQWEQLPKTLLKKVFKEYTGLSLDCLLRFALQPHWWRSRDQPYLERPR